MFGIVTAHGGTQVGPGDYWNFDTGDRWRCADSGVLPGEASAVYYRMPAVLVLALAPVLGLTYAIFLPFAGIASVLVMAGRKVFFGRRARRTV